MLQREPDSAQIDSCVNNSTYDQNDQAVPFKKAGVEESLSVLLWSSAGGYCSYDSFRFNLTSALNWYSQGPKLIIAKWQM